MRRTIPPCLNLFEPAARAWQDLVRPLPRRPAEPRADGGPVARRPVRQIACERRRIASVFIHQPAVEPRGSTLLEKPRCEEHEQRSQWIARLQRVLRLR